MTNHTNPEHYTMHAIEPITYILENKLGFCAGAIVKYITRAGHKLYPGKDRDQSEVADLEKVIQFAQMRIAYLNGDEVVSGNEGESVKHKFTYFHGS